MTNEQIVDRIVGREVLGVGFVAGEAGAALVLRLSDGCVIRVAGADFVQIAAPRLWMPNMVSVLSERDAEKSAMQAIEKARAM